MCSGPKPYSLASSSGAREECTPTATRTTPAGSCAPGVLSTPDKQNRCRGSLLRRDPCPRSQLATRSPRCFASSNFPARAHRVLSSPTQTTHPPALEGHDACVRGSHDPIDREGGLNSASLDAVRAEAHMPYEVTVQAARTPQGGDLTLEGEDAAIARVR